MRLGLGRNSDAAPRAATRSASRHALHGLPRGLPLGRAAQPKKLLSDTCRQGIRVEALGDGCPWEVLGVPPDADTTVIRRAYRRLALKHHPDLDPAPEAPKIFVAIHEAYEILTGRRRGNEAAHRPTASKGWDFHDWYWSFMSRRRQASSKAGQAAASSTGPQPLSSAHLQQQLAGLRRKAASRAWQKRHAAPNEPPLQQQQQQQYPADMAGSPAEQSQPEAQNCSNVAVPPSAASRQAARQVRSNAVTLRAGSPRPSARRAASRQPQDSGEASLERERQPVSGGVATLERPQQASSKQEGEPASAGPQEAGTAPPEIRSQLAGLRRRAALRRHA